VTNLPSPPAGSDPRLVVAQEPGIFMNLNNDRENTGNPEIHGPGIVYPIKVALFLRNFRIGGAERQAFELAKHMDKRKYEVMVIALRGYGELRDSFQSLSDVRVVILGGASSLVAFFRLLRTIRKNRLQILQSFLVATNVYTLFAKLFLRRVKIILGLRDSIADFYMGYTSLPWRAKMWMLKFCLDHLGYLGDLYIANSEAGKNLYDPEFHIRAAVIPNGIDTERFKPDPAAALRLREVVNASPDARVVGILGNCTLYKDYPTFVHAAKVLVGQNSNIHFIAMGEDRTPLGPSVKVLVEQSGLRSAFHFLGPRLDVEKLLPGLDVLCSSSITEGFSNSIAEAMACGVPCVVTDVGDSRKIVGDTGIVVPPGNSQALAVGVTTLLEIAPLALQDMRSAARLRIQKHFDVAGLAMRHQQLYEALISDNSLAARFGVRAALPKGDRSAQLDFP
jgi:glycosyltransferase involved in cell wall biosynthesis